MLDRYGSVSPTFDTNVNPNKWSQWLEAQRKLQPETIVPMMFISWAGLGLSALFFLSELILISGVTTKYFANIKNRCNIRYRQATFKCVIWVLIWIGFVIACIVTQSLSVQRHYNVKKFGKWRLNNE